MSRREKALHIEMQPFCKYHLGKGCFAPFTGGDWPTWCAFVYLLRRYGNGGDQVIPALRATLALAQHTEAVLRVFVQAIPGVLDWSYVAQIWPQIVEGVCVKDWRHLCAIERSESYVKDDNKVHVRIWQHGLGAPATHQEVAHG